MNYRFHFARPLVLVPILLFVGCDNQHGEVERLRSENAALRRELEDYKASPVALLSETRAALEKGRIADARASANKLAARHPNSGENEEATRAIAAYEAQLAAESAATERERKRLAEEQAARVAAATTRMVKDRDDVKGITWFRDRSSEPPITVNNYDQPRNRFYLYFGVPDTGGAPWLRFRAQYYSDEWLFVQSFTIAADKARFESGPVEFERDNGSGNIWEWYDTGVTASELKWIRAVISAKSATIRFEGRQYYGDKRISATQVAALQRVLDAFVAMGGHLPES